MSGPTETKELVDLENFETMLDSNGRVALPKPIRDKLGLGHKNKFLVYLKTKGDLVTLSQDEDILILRRVKLVPIK